MQYILALLAHIYQDIPLSNPCDQCMEFTVGCWVLDLIPVFGGGLGEFAFTSYLFTHYG
jgi:hypothetical protein